MEKVMYIIASKEPLLSPGKLAVQVAHAAINGYFISLPKEQKEWLLTDQKKILLEVRNGTRLQLAQAKLQNTGISCRMIRDLGLTEVEPGTKTALAVQIVDKEETHELFKRFQLYK